MCEIKQHDFHITKQSNEEKIEIVQISNLNAKSETSPIVKLNLGVKIVQ